MFNLFKRWINVADVKENYETITISGLDVNNLAYDIKKVWETERVFNNMFDVVGKNSIRFNKFFGVDVLYVLQAIQQYSTMRSNKYRTNQIIELLLTNTWLRTL